MRITICSRIPVKWKFSRLIIDLLLLIVAIPVIVVASVSIAVYYLFARLFAKQTAASHAEDRYRVEVPLVQLAGINITLVEDETDQQLTAANEDWIYHVYDEDTYLFRLKTNPLIAGLENKIGGLYFKEVENGIIVQLLKENSRGDEFPDTEFVFVDKRNLEVSSVDHAGPFFLYNDDKQPALIRGFNKKEKVEFRIEV